MNAQLVTIEHHEVKSPGHKYLTNLKLEALLISFDVKANSIHEAKELVFEKVFIFLENFYKAVSDKTDSDQMEKLSLAQDKVMSNTNLGRQINRLPVPICEDIDNNGTKSSKEKLMELILRFRQSKW